MPEAPEAPLVLPLSPYRHLWAPSFLFLAFFVIFSANARKIGNADTLPAMVLPVAILRGDGPFLDRWSDDLQNESAVLPNSVSRSRGHVVSRFPIAPALLAVPLYWPQVLVLDLLKPGWDRPSVNTWAFFNLVEKNSAAVIASLVGVVLYSLLRKIGLSNIALPIVLAGMFGSSLWSSASQSLWPHGPAALTLSLGLILVVDGTFNRRKLFGAGTATGLLIAFNLADVLFAVPIVIWVTQVLKSQRAQLLWFYVPFATIVVTLIAWNLYYFGSLLGGLSELDERSLNLIPGSGFLEGLAGTLISPSRGLFIFTPWIAVALSTLPFTWRRIGEHPLLSWMVLALVPYAYFRANDPIWWGGQSFGSRVWTDAVPVLIVILGFGFDWAWNRSIPVLLAFLATISIAVSIQVIGTFYYPSTWYDAPNSVESHTGRFWDISDHEIGRCLEEGMHRPKALSSLWGRFAPVGPQLPQ